MAFNSITEYHDACIGQVTADNRNGVACVYLPNTVACEAPRYCLVGAEPSCSGFGVKGMTRLVDAGMTNFMFSLGDFVLQMCAFEYLCDKDFRYIVTDLSKGAMPVEQAQNGRRARYQTWLPILREELALYGDPTLVAVGNDASNFLNAVGLIPALRVYHYSRNVNWRFGRRYTESPADHPLTADLEIRLKTFMQQLFEAVNYPEALRRDRLNALLAQPLKTYVRGMYLHYREKFLDSRKEH